MSPRSLVRSGVLLVSEIVLVTGAAAVIVSAALASLPGGRQSWMTRARDLAAAALARDFGYSTSARGDVMTAVTQAGLVSLLVIGGTALLLIAVGVPVGMLSAMRPTSPPVRAVHRVLILMSSLPLLVWATAIFLVVVWTTDIPLQGDTYVVGAVIAAIVSLFLGDRLLCDVIQGAAQSTREIIAEPHMRTVRAAALGFRRHVMQGLVPPLAELLAARAMFLVGGAIVVERIFGVRGLGFTIVHALELPDREPLLILASSLGLVVIGLLFRIASRIAVVLADPRERS
jgi:peptide/nickel transport system permease protein